MQISKICQEADLKWPEALPLILLHVRKWCSKEKISPYEIIYGRQSICLTDKWTSQAGSAPVENICTESGYYR